MASYEVLSVDSEDGLYITLAVRFDYKEQPQEFIQQVVGLETDAEKQEYADNLERDVVAYWDSLDNSG